MGDTDKEESLVDYFIAMVSSATKLNLGEELNDEQAEALLGFVSTLPSAQLVFKQTNEYFDDVIEEIENLLGGGITDASTN